MGIAPAPRLPWLVFAVCFCAAQAPWAPRAPQVAAALAAALAAAALWDLAGHFTQARLQVAVAGEDGAPTAQLRLIQGRAAALRLRISGLGRARWRLALMAAEPQLAEALAFPLETFALPAALWTGEIVGRARGRFRGLRCGFERGSHLGLWRLREWHTLECDFRIYPDLAAARRALLRSPVYRALVASAVVPLTGQGREFERLREYQPGDSYADVNWKATARRAAPITRLFQWERSQEIYCIVDHSRLSGMTEDNGRPRLERLVETALAGAMAATAVGDRYGLIGVGGEVTVWLAAGNGRAHFLRFREALLGLAPTSSTPDFERLFRAIRLRLRRRCYLLYLGDLSERGLAESFAVAARLARGTHLVLAQSLLPAGARPLEAAPAAASLAAIYSALADERELQRVQALGPRLAPAGIQFRAASEERFLAAAVDGYLENKRGQRL